VIPLYKLRAGSSEFMIVSDTGIDEAETGSKPAAFYLSKR